METIYIAENKGISIFYAKNVSSSEEVLAGAKRIVQTVQSSLSAWQNLKVPINRIEIL